MSAARSSQSGSNTVEDFKAIADEIVRLGDEAGVRIIGYRDPRLPLFRGLDPRLQKRIVEDLKVHRDICAQTLADGHELTDSRQLIWYALRRLGFIPPSDLFGYLDDQMVIEIHDPDLHQVFRNFVFYDYCSYCLEELHCAPWTELYERDEEAMNAMLDVVRRVYSGAPQVLRCDGVKHFIRETRSAFKLQMNYELVYACGLRGATRGTEAMLICERAEILNPPSVADEERLLREYTAPL